MRSLFAMLTAAAFVVALGAPAFAADMTVKGEVVDAQCYTKRGAEKGSGEAHANCAMSCAKKGSTLAIVTPEGGVYTITGDMTNDSNAKLLEFVAKKVEAKGDVTEADGKKSINVSKIALEKKSTY